MGIQPRRLLAQNNIVALIFPYHYKRYTSSQMAGEHDRSDKNLSSDHGMTKVYHPYTSTWEGVNFTAKSKVEVKYTFLNPNSTREIEKLLRQIIFEKLLSMNLEPTHTVEETA